MISKDKSHKLIAIYLFICDLYEKELKFICQRFTNNDSPDFTDQEIITIYLFVMHVEQRLKIKHIYNFTKDYLLSWFPLLPSYQAFVMRLNRLSEVFQHISYVLISEYPPDCSNHNMYLLDSMPIITCSGKRKGAVAQELTEKGYCSTKSMYYYGVKLHALALRAMGHLPFPDSFIITPASENDLNVFKQEWAHLSNRFFFGDKIYHNTDFFDNLSNSNKSYMLTPVKAVKNKPDCLKNFDKAFEDLYSTAVSKIRQPIESLFNWLIEKTDIQRASKVRSSKGLLVHIFGKIAAAFIFLIFNS